MRAVNYTSDRILYRMIGAAYALLILDRVQHFEYKFKIK